MNDSRKLQGRNVGADIIRCLAFFCVISVHFFLHNGFYQNTVLGEKMFLAVFMRCFFIICVPLYMMLSGYLMRNKKITADYYKKLGRTYLTYVLACVCCIIYSNYYLKTDFDFKKSVFSVLNFSAAPYAWYVEMYLGLFLIIPFLNILYNNLSSKNQKKVLILILVIITSLPAVINVYNFEMLDWWRQPSNSRVYQQILPEWWTPLYPVTYYMIGCYLSEYGLKIKKALNISLIFIVWIISSIYNYWRSYNGKFISGNWCDYESIANVLLTTLVFAFFININYDKVSNFFVKIFKNVSGLCFASYLVSWIFDSYFYAILIEKVPKMIDRLQYYIIIVPIIFICSLLLSFIIGKIQWLLEYLFDRIKRLAKNN